MATVEQKIAEALKRSLAEQAAAAPAQEPAVSSTRDWLYDVMTRFGNDVSVRLGNRITNLAIWCNGKADAVEQARWDAINYINELMNHCPPPFDQALLWFWSLCNNYLLTPGFTAVRNVFVGSSQLIVSFYENWNMMYIPERWLRDIIWNVRDRVINLLDDTASLITSVQSWTTGLVTGVHNYFQPLIDNLNAWRSALSTWIQTNIIQPINHLSSDVTDIGTRLYNVEQAVLSLNDDPAYWIWTRIEASLRARIESWLNAIWNTRI